MFGSDRKATAQCKQLLCEIYDLRNIMTQHAYGDTEPTQVLTNTKKHLKKLEAWLQLEAKALTEEDNDK